MLFPAAAVWTPLCVAAQSTSFLLVSIFRLHGCYFSGWGSRVGGLLISETSVFTIDNGGEAGKGRTTELWRSPPNRQRRSAFKKARLLWQKKKVQESSFVPAHIGVFAVVLSALCIAPMLRAARGNGICTTHNCSERLLVGEKAKPLIFARKKESCLPKVEYTWNWNVRRTKASLRHWKRENWNIFENIWKKSNTPQGSVFLEWTIVNMLLFSSRDPWIRTKSSLYSTTYWIPQEMHRPQCMRVHVYVRAHTHTHTHVS